MLVHRRRSTLLCYRHVCSLWPYPRVIFGQQFYLLWNFGTCLSDYYITQINQTFETWSLLIRIYTKYCLSNQIVDVCRLYTINEIKMTRSVFCCKHARETQSVHFFRRQVKNRLLQRSNLFPSVVLNLC